MPADVVKAANAQLADHQRIRAAQIWPGAELPRTEGTRKLKRHEIRAWLQTGAPPAATASRGYSVESVIARYTGGRALEPGATLEEMGLSSLERIEMMVALEEALNTTIDETAFSNVKTVADLERLAAAPATAGSGTRAGGVSVVESRAAVPRASRGRQPVFLLPLTRVFAWITVDGLQHLRTCKGPVIFAANHQSHMDVPVILAALPGRWRRRVATAMAKEFFKAHFFPEGYSRGKRFAKSLEYYLSAAFFNTFPLPQREAGARQTLRYAGELDQQRLFGADLSRGQANGPRRDRAVSAGVGMMAARLGRAGDSGPPRRHRSRPAPDMEDGKARARARHFRRAAAAKWR